jgi:RNA polymerase sigma factor (sigma-70 family)
MDHVLLPYLQATNESERQQHLDELLLLHAAPAIKTVLRIKLGYYVDHHGANPSNQDAGDLYQEIIAKIIRRLRDLETARADTDIEDFKRYVSRAATNVCIDRWRLKLPARRRLKDNIRSLLSKHPDFAIWKDGGDSLCGFVAWGDAERSSDAEREPVWFEEKLGEFCSTRFAGEVVSEAPLSRIVAELFQWTGTPIELDRLVNIIGPLLKLEQHSAESLDEDVHQSSTTRVAWPLPTAVSRIENQEFLHRLWRAVKRFPPEQRNAFCLRFHDGSGNDFFSVLIEYKVASWSELAHEFGRSPEELWDLRSQMPMDGSTAAAQLNTSRLNINKWRFRAVGRLKKELLPLTNQKK